MNENQAGSSYLLDTTDCLEAVGVFKGWKNFFFIILVLCILLLQACFWLVDLNIIPVPENAASGSKAFTIPLFMNTSGSNNISGNSKESAVPEKKPAENVPAKSAEPNQAGGPVILAAQTTTPSPNNVSGIETAKKEFLDTITFEHIAWTIRFVDAIFILVAALYCLTMLFSLKVSMLGRLGGINHITKAFFLSLIMFVLVLPWQKVFDSVIMGAVFTPSELVKWHAARTGEMLDMVLYYMRFCGYMVLVFLLLLLAQIRSGKWAKAILRRLEII